MPTETPLDKEHPLMKAWEAYASGDDYANSFKWAAHEQHRKGSMWGAYMAGWIAATKRAGGLHEQVNPASDDERLKDIPGAGAMGAIIGYRDTIRKQLP